MTSNKPVRVQLSRKKGWRMPPNTVKVDRTTPFGNPFPIGVDRQASVEAFRLWISSTDDGNAIAERAKKELAGKNLACWCPLGCPCHADVLIEVANSRCHECRDANQAASGRMRNRMNARGA